MGVLLVWVGYLDDFLDDEGVVFGTDADMGERVVVVYRFNHLPLLIVLLHAIMRLLLI